MPTPRKPTRHPVVTFDQSRALVSVARTGSFNRTAAELGLRSATSVFHLIGRMEATIGRGPLVGPSVKGQVQLTAIGNEVLPQAQALVNAYDAFVEGRHEIRISCYPSVAGRLAKALSDFNDRHQQVEVVFYEVADQSRRDRGESLLDRATTGEIDLVVAPAGYVSPELTESTVYEWTLRVILPNADARRGRPAVTVDDLAEMHFVTSPLGHASRRLFDSASRGAKQRPRIAMELVDQYVVKELAREGNRYAAVMPDDAFGAPDPGMGPALVSDDGARYSGWYSLYYSGTHPAAAKDGSTRSRAILDFAVVVSDVLLT